MGNVLKDIVTFLLPALIIIVVSIFTDFHIHAGGLTVIHPALYIDCVVSAANSSLELVSKDIGTIAAVVTGLQLPITLLAGFCFLSLLGPAWLQVLTRLNPLYYVVETSQEYSNYMIQSIIR